MTQTHLFLNLFVSVTLIISGILQIAQRKYPMGALLLFIPVCFWISMVFGT